MSDEQSRSSDDVTRRLSRKVTVYLCICFGIGIGCNKPSHAPASSGAKFERYTTNWTKYSSPNGRISIEYPGSFPVKARPRTNDDDPDVAAVLDDQDELLQVTILIRTFAMGDAPALLDAISGGDADKALTSREPFTVVGGTGYRQLFAEVSNGTEVEYISISVASSTDYLQMTIGCPKTAKGELWPVCERIAQSIRFVKSSP